MDRFAAVATKSAMQHHCLVRFQCHHLFCYEEKIMPQNKLPAIAAAVITLFITYLHYSSVGAGHELHNIYRELYYIPVFLGALAYGLKGAALSYLLLFALYLPYVIMTWPGTLLNETNRLLPLLLQGLFAFIAGYLVDREKTQRTQVEKNRHLVEIGRIATVIVHDLKNPLIAIFGFAGGSGQARVRPTQRCG
jgi:two-component system, NtrC family, sensor histidine kinase HydH